MAKINSDYFLRNIFAFLELKKQLQLIIYNKHLQNKLNLNLINYKIFSGKYIIYENETNTKGKIINAYNDMVYYDGEFLKGKKHGKGKEYYDYGVTIKLKFEGEYLNGKRNGKGKEYDSENGSLMFEGEYLNGERSGKGKELNYDYIIFDGEYLNGERYKGIIKGYYIMGQIRHITEYVNGKIWNRKEYDLDGNVIYQIQEGKGTRIYNYNGNKVEYEYFDGINVGKMKAYDKNLKLKYEKEFNNGKIWNMKVYDENNHIIYELHDGKGLTKDFDEYLNLEFEGEYLNGVRNGKGKEFQNRRLIFEGEYLNGKRNGKGKEYNRDEIVIFEGEYLDGKRNGKGKEYDEDGKLKFDGEFFYDHRIRGRLYFKGKLEFEGEFIFDRKYSGTGYDSNGDKIYELNNGTGKVIEYYENGMLKYEGEYLNEKKMEKLRNILIME